MVEIFLKVIKIINDGNYNLTGNDKLIGNNKLK